MYCLNTASQLESLCPMVELINRNKCPFASGPKKESKHTLLGPEKEKIMLTKFMRRSCLIDYMNIILHGVLTSTFNQNYHF